ncbi:hypothetical protein K437DRAFT_257745 [Tilletiaria anomala UBC 951]|uniref:Peptidase S28 n=1 Tax=Tilletiaria anomala (strain ATCC 24038 / CBS 436.72 / UBC 951) TaxID=1037660 RepID=A0A066VMK7_TILAU|nr:uncharacterized protein K437DRAFT_257745 [Tilletiaria anomala UBC 951]KDN42721.1 hypothetical protein K437DRAFT_257745 [Tilletiaria anomala UBC 951]
MRFATALLLLSSLEVVVAHVGHPDWQLKTPKHAPGLHAFHAAKQQESLADRRADAAVLLWNDEAQLTFNVNPKTGGSLTGKYPAYTFTQPLDHFDPSNNVTFEQRYWFSTKYYKPPSHRKEGEKTVVYVLDSGETNAEGRLPYLDHGILDILAGATGGISVVLEHRYYGKSYPPRSVISPPGPYWDSDAMRFLNNTQALEDSANFVRQIKFPGVEEDLTGGPNKTRWISYGGSYPGARSAHLRVLYPELFTGAIASSAVVQAIEDYPEYMYPIARGAEASCAQAIQAAVAGFDSIAVPLSKAARHEQRDAFLEIMGTPNLTHVADLANLWAAPLGSFQALNWDASISSQPFWDSFCGNITAATDRSAQLMRQGNAHNLSLPKETYQYAAFIRDNFADDCLRETQGTAQASVADLCFGTYNYTDARQTTTLNAGHSWVFQTCQTWGYFQSAPPEPTPGHPAGPKLISSLIDHNYSTEVCRQGYLPGKHYNLPAHPNISEVNALGGFALSTTNLALIDGQYDPWRPACAHSEEYAFGGARSDTLERPFKLIPDCWHHCDENSLPVAQRDNEPPRIKAIHQEQVEFVKHWLHMP